LPEVLHDNMQYQIMTFVLKEPEILAQSPSVWATWVCTSRAPESWLHWCEARIVLSAWSWRNKYIQILIYKILLKILARVTQDWAMQLLKFTKLSCDQLCCRMCWPLLSQSSASGTQSTSVYKLFDTSDFLISRDNISTVKERWDNCSSKAINSWQLSTGLDRYLSDRCWLLRSSSENSPCVFRWPWNHCTRLIASQTSSAKHTKWCPSGVCWFIIPINRSTYLPLTIEFS
jgi:hypothetical protein